MDIQWTTITDIVQETPDTRTYYLDPPEGFQWQSGAHTHFALEGFYDGDTPDKSMVRHMSISTLPRENKIGITTRIRAEKSRFKGLLDQTNLGDPVALFKTGARLPIHRENKALYFLSSGVGIATFRPLVLEYLENHQGVSKVQSLNIDSSNDVLFPDIFVDHSEKNFYHEYINNRTGYYERVNHFAKDKDAYFYVVGSDEFLTENLSVLLQEGIEPQQILLDKHESQRLKFFN